MGAAVGLGLLRIVIAGGPGAPGQLWNCCMPPGAHLRPRPPPPALHLVTHALPHFPSPTPRAERLQDAATTPCHTHTAVFPPLSPQNDYKTLDPTFMESVWWVFKQLFDKGLVYRGFKVRPRAGF